MPQFAHALLLLLLLLLLVFTLSRQAVGVIRNDALLSTQPAQAVAALALDERIAKHASAPSPSPTPGGGQQQHHQHHHYSNPNAAADGCNEH